MGEVLLFDAARMKQIEDTTVVSGLVDIDGNLLLTQRNGVQLNAGYVKGNDGADGTPGTDGTDGVDGKDGLIAAGMILDWPSDVPAPPFAKDCNGLAVSRSLYSTLFGVVGIKYGAGDGSTTFNLPDIKNSLVVLGEGFRTDSSLFTLTATLADVPGLTVTGKTDGSPVRIDIDTIFTNPNSGDNRYLYVQLVCDGVEVAALVNNRIVRTAAAGDERYTFASSIEHTPTAGTHTWTVKARASVGAGGQIAHGSLVVNQVKPMATKKIIVVNDQGTPNTYIPEGMAFGMGMIVAWPGVVGAPIPANTLELNGQTVSAETYSGLAALFPAWVQGVDLLLPDLRKRTIAGYLAGDPKFGTLGGLIGADSHLLTANQSGIRPHSHAITGRSTAAAGGSGDNMMRGTGGVDPNFRTSTFVATTESYNSPAAEPNALEAHNNVQPTYIGRWLIIASDGAGEYSPTVQAALVSRIIKQETKVSFHASRQTVVAKSGAQSKTKMPFDLVNVNRGGAYDPVLSRFTAPVSGIYEFQASLAQATNATGPILYVWKNGVEIFPAEICIAYYQYVLAHGTRQIELLAGDYIELYLANANGTTISVGSYGTAFSGKLIEAY